MSRWVVALAVAAVLSLLGEQRLIDLAAHLEHAPALPIPVVEASFGPPQGLHVALVGLGAVQTLILWGIWHALRDGALGAGARIAIALSAAAMLAIALSATTLTSFDPYAYAGYAKLASLHAAYAPPPERFSGTFGTINDAWGVPMVASYYGPLWITLDRLVAGAAPTLPAALLGLRLLEAGALAVLLVAFALRGAGTLPLVLLALNPAVYELYVANAHNDLLAIALVAVALAFVARVPPAAVLCVALAALVKLPLVILALVVFAGRGALLRRSALVALTVVLALLASWALGGAAYFHDLFFRLGQVDAAAAHGVTALSARAIKLALALLAIVALGAAFARGVVWRAAGWSTIALSSMVYPWYLAWPVAYAALERGALVGLLVLFPLAAALLDVAFEPLGLGQLAMLAMFVAAVVEIARRRALTIVP